MASPRRVRQGITCALIIVVVGAVILPILSAVIDHHALEKLPDHRHIYPGGVPVDHSHAHEAAQDHSDEAIDAGETGIMFLPPTDGTGVSGFTVVSVALALSLAVVISSHSF